MAHEVDAPAVVARCAANSTINVLHVVNGEHYSGAERVQDLLAGALPASGYQVGFACLKAGRFAETRCHQQVPLQTFPMRSRWDLGVASQVAAMAREGHYQLVHAHTPRSLMVARKVAKICDLPLVYHVHSPTGRDSTRAWQNRLNLWMETRQLRSARRLICVSTSLANYMRQQGHPDTKIRVVPNGVPQVAWHDRSPPRDTWTLGTVALFRPRKGIELLLQAVAQAKQSALPVKLLAVGPFETPEYEASVRHLMDSIDIRDRIEWAGFQRDVEPWMRRMDAFVLPSLFGEGLPMVVLEAMASGVPIIASDVEGIPQAVRDRQDGLIFSAGDPQSLYERLRAMVQGEFDWQQMRRSAWSRQREAFSDLSMANQVARVYDELLARETPPALFPQTEWVSGPTHPSTPTA